MMRNSKVFPFPPTAGERPLLCKLLSEKTRSAGGSLSVLPLALCIPLLLLLAAPCWAAHEEIRAFMLKRGCTEILVQKLSGNAHSSNCIQTESHVICFRSRSCPAQQCSPQSRQALLRGLTLRVRRDLYERLLHSAGTAHYQNSAAAREAYLRGVADNDARYILKGVEFLTGAEEGRLEAVAAAPHAGLTEAIAGRYGQRDFVERYCETLLPKARELFGQERYPETLTILKEMHDLKWARADAYILACQAFINNGEPEEAGKLADEVMSDLEPQLTADLAEQLGDVYMMLQREDQAEKAYRLASSRL